MELVILCLDDLAPHPANSNVMPEVLLAKLARQIERSDRYPPIITRPWRTATSTHQILDGHHRVEALRRLGRDEVRCVVWDVDDDEALLLLATLNRLEGDDDALRRGALLDELGKRMGRASLLAALPEGGDAVDRLIGISRGSVEPREPEPLEAMRVAVHFFLLPRQRRTLDARLRSLGGQRDEALMQLVEAANPEESKR